MQNYSLSDLTLSRRLERCEGSTNAAFVDARARLQPEVGATKIERDGAFALFDGIGSPLTQTFALGIFEPATHATLDTIEEFFTSRGADVFHEVSPLAGQATLELLVARGYHPVELTSVMHRPIASFAGEDTGQVRARIADESEIEHWSEVSGEGWSEFGDLSEFVRGIGRVSASSKGATAFFAELDGRAIGTGAVTIHESVALLAGASTIPSARNQGAQRALLQARLQYAAKNGCDLAMMCAAPGSASQRNAERQGFRIAYTRIKWGR